MTLSIDTLELKSGSHKTRDDGLCVMEAVAWLAGEEHSDQPQCASTVITKFAIGLNDTWDDDRRQELIPYTKLMVNTRDGHDQERGLMAADWLLRTYTPAWLRLAGLTEEAESLSTAAPLTDWSGLAGFMTPLETAKKAGAAAWDAAGAAAWDAARDAAGDAAGDAAWAVAWAVAWDAARDALQPTVMELQDSALDLLDRMSRVGRG